MNNYALIAVIAVLAIIGGGVYYNVVMPEPAVMMEKGDDMMGDGEKMMKEGEEMMEEGAMMKKEGESMMKEEGAMMKEDGAMMEKAPEGAMMSAGSYEVFAPDKISKASEGDVVLFFRASWCPTCRSLDADIRKNASSIPKGVTILEVDYDSSTSLKQKYGVTYQHTLIQVDQDGNQIAKWMGSPTLASLLTNVK